MARTPLPVDAEVKPFEVAGCAYMYASRSDLEGLRSKKFDGLLGLYVLLHHML